MREIPLYDSSNAVTVTHFKRTTQVGTEDPNAVVLAKSIPVTIIESGVPVYSGNIEYNLAGEVLTFPSSSDSDNASIAYTRTDPTPVPALTTISTRTVDINGAAIAQTRTVTRNAANQILTISAWQ